MRRLPLFPLPVVLFPGALLPLHVFEPRYRRMMAYCLEGDRRFGVVYHDPDRAGPYEVEHGQVGCVAEILRFEPLSDGRSMVLAGGRDRFLVEDGIESDAPYYEALVDEYPDLDGKRRGIMERRHTSIDLFHRVLEEVLDHDGPLPPFNPRSEMAFQLAQVIRVDPLWQQALLETRGERPRLDQIDALLHTVLEGGAETYGRRPDSPSE